MSKILHKLSKIPKISQKISAFWWVTANKL